MADPFQPILDHNINYLHEQNILSTPHLPMCQSNEAGSIQQSCETVTNILPSQPAPGTIWGEVASHGQAALEPPHQLADLEPAAWPAFNSLPTLDDYLSSSDQVQRDQARFYRKPSLSEPPHQSHLLPQPFEHSQNTLFDHTLDQRQPTSLALQRPSQRSSAQIPNQPTLHRFGGISSASPTSTENHILNAETLVAQALKKITTTACEALIKATPQIIDEALKNLPATLRIPSRPTTSPTTSEKKRARSCHENDKSPSSHKRSRLDSVDFENIKGLRDVSGDVATNSGSPPKRGRGRPRRT